MLKILDEKILKTDDEMEEQYKDCKYLYIIDSYEKLIDHNWIFVLCQYIRGILQGSVQDA